MNRAHGAELSPFARWGLMGLLMGCTALGHFNRVGISVAGSEIFIPKIGISEDQMGWVYTAFLITYTLGMVPGGWLIDRIGSAWALTGYAVLMGIFVALTGVVGWLVDGPQAIWLGLLAIRSLGGVCSSPLHPGAAHVVSHLLPTKQRATGNGLVTAGALLGIAFCFPIFGGLLDHWGWPGAFVVSGVALVGYGLLWRFATSSVESLRPHTSHAEVKERSPHEAASQRASSRDGSGGWSLLRSPGLWLLALSYAAYGYFQYLFFYWMDYYFKSILNVPKDDARQASFWIMLAMGGGMLFGGLGTDVVCNWLGTKLGRRVIVIAGMGLSAIFAVVAVNQARYEQVALCLAVSMGALGMCEGVFWTTATTIGGKWRGFSGAFMNALGNVGGLFSPVVTPILAGKMGWPGAITVACIINGAGGLLWFLIHVPDEPTTVVGTLAADEE